MNQPSLSAPADTIDEIAGAFTFYSPEIKHTFLPQHYADQYGCRGDNLSPALAWMNVPEGAGSLAVTVFDPDAPGNGYWHWLVYNLPGDLTELPPGAGHGSGRFLPEHARQVINDAHTVGYFGPCPPKGQRHRYVFTLYACPKLLHLSHGESPFVIERELQKSEIAHATFTVYGERVTGNG